MVNRRTFLKLLGLAPAAAIIGKEVIASPAPFAKSKAMDAVKEQKYLYSDYSHFNEDVIKAFDESLKNITMKDILN